MMQEHFPCHFKLLCTCNIQNVIIANTDNIYCTSCLLEHATVWGFYGLFTNLGHGGNWPGCGCFLCCDTPVLSPVYSSYDLNMG